MRLNVRDGWWGDHPSNFPGKDAPLGYAWMVRQRRLDVMPNHRWSFAARVGGRQSVQFHDLTWEVFPLDYAPDDLAGQLEFALKYDGINLEILRTWFDTLTVDEVETLENWVRSSPTSAYVRKAWFLYEMLTARTLAVPDGTSGGYVPVLDLDGYFVAAGRRSKRHRVLDNLFGSRDFCAVVRKTPALQTLAARQLSAHIGELLAQHDADTLTRVVSYLYTKETRSSYEIEREKPTTDRVKHFVSVLQRAHDWPSLSHDDLVNLQNLIVTDPRNRAGDYRTEQNYVGGPGPLEIAFVSPRPEDIRPMMVAWLEMVDRLAGCDVDAVVAAAAAAFSFVFLHPFLDGNGRIHRFLIHYLLARKRFTPAGALVPVSATMLARMKEYDAALERYSVPLMARLRYDLDSEFRVEVLHDSSGYYRYPDLTVQAEALYGWVAAAIDEDVPKELTFMLAYRDARRRVVEIVELPDQKAEHFVLSCIQQGGRLSNNLRRHKNFANLSAVEANKMEAAVRAAMLEHGMPVTE